MGLFLRTAPFTPQFWILSVEIIKTGLKTH
jgi:hypothetical protein